MINMLDCNVDTNTARLCGDVIEGKAFSHRVYGESFYTFVIGILRNSGYEDRMTVMASERILDCVDLEEGSMVAIDGQIRTYNESVDGRNHLNIVIFAKEIYPAEEDDEYCNEIYLEGYICKEPVGRVSPMGRRICDVMLAVNRMYNKSDYIPCIAWGRNARFAESLSVGDKISLKGRFQSRKYKKRDENSETVTKIAYEVSILQLETCDEW